jgi:ribosome assembly protein 4
MFYLISASKDSTAKLWEIPSGKRAKETLQDTPMNK